MPPRTFFPPLSPPEPPPVRNYDAADRIFTGCFLCFMMLATLFVAGIVALLFVVVYRVATW